MSGKSPIATLRRGRPAAQARLTRTRKPRGAARTGCGPRTLRSPTRWPSRKTD